MSRGSSRDIEREVFSRCSETCPAVDEAIDSMLSDIGHYIAPANESEVSGLVQIMRSIIKDEGTERLREALRECVSDRRVLEDEVDELRRQVSDLQGQIENMEVT